MNSLMLPILDWYLPSCMRIPNFVFGSFAVRPLDDTLKELDEFIYFSLQRFFLIANVVFQEVFNHADLERI
jgi:hypothetical protein